MTTQLKKIGEIAELLGTTPRTLRYYEAEGLITARRSSGGTRYYGEEDIARFRAVLRLAETGLPLSKIGTREFLEKLLHAIAYREGFGDILAEGMMRARENVPEMARAFPDDSALAQASLRIDGAAFKPGPLPLPGGVIHVDRDTRLSMSGTPEGTTPRGGLLVFASVRSCLSPTRGVATILPSSNWGFPGVIDVDVLRVNWQNLRKRESTGAFKALQIFLAVLDGAQAFESGRTRVARNDGSRLQGDDAVEHL